MEFRIASGRAGSWLARKNKIADRSQRLIVEDIMQDASHLDAPGTRLAIFYDGTHELHAASRWQPLAAIRIEMNQRSRESAICTRPKRNTV